MIRKIYLIHHTHFDIGFTDLAREVIQKQVGYLSDAIRLCEADPEYRWTIESGSLLRNWLDSQEPRQQERILKLLRSGQMELGGFDMQMLTETASFSELYANVFRSARLGRRFGFPVECAVLDDIGGFCGELPRLMNEAGIRYLICGVGACQAELPWAGLPHLFYLKCRSGGKILAWNLGIDRNERSCDSRYPFAVYGLGGTFLGFWAMPEFLGKKDMGIQPNFKNGKTDENPASAAEAFQILLDRLDREKYPYEEILLQYGGDNRGPCPDLAALVRKLNASGMFPEIRFSTPSGFMRMMEDKYSARIPELDGVLTDPWNLRMNAIPAVLKRFRKAQRKYEYLRSKGIADPIVQENLMLCCDHTFGLNIWGWQKNSAETGIRDRIFDRVRQSWADKRYYAETAYRRCLELEQKHVIGADAANEKAVVIANTSPHTVSGSAELYLGSYAPLLKALRTAAGQTVPFQKIALNRYVLEVKDVPALGKIRLIPEFSDVFEEDLPPERKPLPEQIRTDSHCCRIAPDGSIGSISGKGGLLFTNGKFGVFEQETLYDIDQANEHCNLRPCFDRKAFPMTGTEGALIGDGELFRIIRTRGKCRGTAVDIMYRFWKHHPRIDVNIRLDLPETSEKICCRVLFPFAGDSGKWIFDQNAGIVDPSRLLPGGVEEFFFCSRYFMLNEENYSAVVCCPDAPVAELGNSRAGQWRTKIPYRPANSNFSGLIGNNLMNTDSPAWLRLRDDFSYSIFLTQDRKTPADAQGFWETAVALEARLSYEKEESSSPVARDLREHIGDDGTVFVEDLSSGRIIPKNSQCSVRSGNVPGH